jgi:hypothetical protein
MVAPRGSPDLHAMGNLIRADDVAGILERADDAVWLARHAETVPHNSLR